MTDDVEMEEFENAESAEMALQESKRKTRPSLAALESIASKPPRVSTKPEKPGEASKKKYQPTEPESKPINERDMVKWLRSRCRTNGSWISIKDALMCMGVGETTNSRGLLDRYPKSWRYVRSMVVHKDSQVQSRNNQKDPLLMMEEAAIVFFLLNFESANQQHWKSQDWLLQFAKAHRKERDELRFQAITTEHSHDLLQHFKEATDSKGHECDVCDGKFGETELRYECKICQNFDLCCVCYETRFTSRNKPQEKSGDNNEQTRKRGRPPKQKEKSGANEQTRKRGCSPKQTAVKTIRKKVQDDKTKEVEEPPTKKSKIVLSPSSSSSSSSSSVGKLLNGPSIDPVDMADDDHSSQQPLTNQTPTNSQATARQLADTMAALQDFAKSAPPEKQAAVKQLVDLAFDRSFSQMQHLVGLLG